MNIDDINIHNWSITASSLRQMTNKFPFTIRRDMFRLFDNANELVTNYSIANVKHRKKPSDTTKYNVEIVERQFDALLTIIRRELLFHKIKYF